VEAGDSPIKGIRLTAVEFCRNHCILASVSLARIPSDLLVVGAMETIIDATLVAL
jgi:hypothetical protein